MTMVKTIATALILLHTALPGLAQTQMELNREVCDAYQAADESLDAAYRRILLEYQDDDVFLEKFEEAQNAWAAYRDARLAALYPEEDKQMAYGSIFPLCRCSALLEMTEVRMQDLMKWIEGIEEGDPCIGSIRCRDTLAR